MLPMPCCDGRLVRWVVGVLALACAAIRAPAADSLWNLPVNGAFNVAANWFGGVPGLFDRARFEITSSNSPSLQRTYSVDFTNNPTNDQLVVEDDNVTFNLNGHTYTVFNDFVGVAVGTVPNRSGNLTVAGGTVGLDRLAALEIAPVAGARGVLTVGAGGSIIGSPIGSPDVQVGLNGNGTLNINSGGDVIADLVSIGKNAGSTGTAAISGDGSSLTGSVTVGEVGNGELNVNDGGDITSPSGAIGRRTASIGTANVQGNGSTWSVSNLTIGGNNDFGSSPGSAGLGTLNITSGGQVTSHFAILGSSIGSTGHVNVASTIPGAHSTWTVGGDLFIAVANVDTGGTGTLLIQTGGSVSVAGETRLGSEGSLRLEGGKFKTSNIGKSNGGVLGEISDQFSWTAGTLEVGIYHGNLTVPNSGILMPLRTVDGTTITGDYKQQVSGATLAVDIGGPFQFIDYGVLTSEGATLLGGNLHLTLTNGFVPTALSSFTILRADGGLTGAFANVANGQRLITTDGLGSFVVNYGIGSPSNPNHVVLTAFQPGRLGGDFDHDGDVDGADFLVWQRGGSPIPASAADLVAWRVNFGTGGTAAASGAVPEPAAFMVLTSSVTGLIFRGRRIRRSI